MSRSPTVRAYALPILAAPALDAPSLTFAVTHGAFRADEPPADVIRDTWTSMNELAGQVRLRPGEIVEIKMRECFDPFAGLVAATIGQFMGMHLRRQELLMSMHDTPANGVFYVGDPTYADAVLAHLDGKPLRLQPKHKQLDRLLQLVLKELRRKAEQNGKPKPGEAILLGMSSMPANAAMAIGWLLGALTPDNPLQLRHGTEDHTCSLRVVLAPAHAVKAADAGLLGTPRVLTS